jgi:hypothetical protein
LVEVAPNVEAEHVARLIGWPASRRGNHPIETQLGEVQAGDERVDDAN